MTYNSVLYSHFVLLLRFIYLSLILYAVIWIQSEQIIVDMKIIMILFVNKICFESNLSLHSRTFIFFKK